MAEQNNETLLGKRTHKEAASAGNIDIDDMAPTNGTDCADSKSDISDANQDNSNNVVASNPNN